MSFATVYCWICGVHENYEADVSDPDDKDGLVLQMACSLPEDWYVGMDCGQIRAYCPAHNPRQARA